VLDGWLVKIQQYLPGAVEFQSPSLLLAVAMPSDRVSTAEQVRPSVAMRRLAIYSCKKIMRLNVLDFSHRAPMACCLSALRQVVSPALVRSLQFPSPDTRI
jgi:hypothetical protein